MPAWGGLGFEDGGRATYTGKGKEMDFPLKPTERNTALLMPSFWPSETHVGLLTFGTVG